MSSSQPSVSEEISSAAIPTASLSIYDLRFYQSSSSSSWSSSDSSSSDFVNAALPLWLYGHVRKPQKRRRTRRKSFQSVTGSFWYLLSFRTVLKVLGPEKFKTSFRMSHSTFKLLLNEVRDLLQRPFKVVMEYRRCTVPPEIRLAITLIILGCGTYIDLMLAYHIEENTIRRLFHQTCGALTSRLRLKGFPRTISGLQQIARRFQSSLRGTNPLPGCVGALDGICIEIKKPQPCENPALFYCRKGFYAIPYSPWLTPIIYFDSALQSALVLRTTHWPFLFQNSSAKLKEVPFSTFSILSGMMRTHSRIMLSHRARSPT